MRETEDCFDLANFFDEDNQDQIKVYKVLEYIFSYDIHYLFSLETIAVYWEHSSLESL